MREVCEEKSLRRIKFETGHRRDTISRYARDAEGVRSPQLAATSGSR